MTISERYRKILEQIEIEADRLYEVLPENTAKALRQVDRAAEEMQDFSESVGEIPQFQLESKLSPVLLKAHSCLDRARVLLEDAGHSKEGSTVWEMEQLVYRLLNDL
ncbi:MAG: hypothetical protein BA864_13920 [Desulfuromonadales bacterium C00003093]|nr:MAG: hypothetical protein BA864_13920 [Desulfuromonadales bacterium C00003093]